MDNERIKYFDEVSIIFNFHDRSISRVEDYFCVWHQHYHIQPKESTNRNRNTNTNMNMNIDTDTDMKKLWAR